MKHFFLSKLSITILFFGSPVFAQGVRDSGGGLPQRPAIPEVDFAYRCSLWLEEVTQSDQRRVSRKTLTITRNEIDQDEYIRIGAEDWEHGSYTIGDRPHRGSFKPTHEVPDYNLKHGLAFGFHKTKIGWLVNLRANLLFIPMESGALGWAEASFDSPIIGVRIDAADRLINKDFLFDVSCLRVESKENY